MFWWVFETSLTCCQSQNLVWIKMFNKFHVKFLFRRRPLFCLFFWVDQIFQGIQNGYGNILCSGRICWIPFEAFIMDINTFYLPFDFFFSREAVQKSRRHDFQLLSALWSALSAGWAKWLASLLRKQVGNKMFCFCTQILYTFYCYNG